MALTACGGGVNDRRSAGGVTPALRTDNGFVVVSVWYKPAAGGAGTSRTNVCHYGETTGSSAHCYRLGLSTSNQANTTITSNTTSKVGDGTNSSVATSPGWDTWWNFALIDEGPHDGTSNAWETRINDSIWDSGSYTSETHNASLDTIIVGNGANSGDKFAYLGVGVFADLTAARAAVTACMSGPASAVSGMSFAWDLVDDANADLGGVNLSANGTGGSFDSDAPPFGGGGGGGVLIASSFMRHEPPQQQARRLGFSGWRAAVELRRAA